VHAPLVDWRESMQAAEDALLEPAGVDLGRGWDGGDVWHADGDAVCANERVIAVPRVPA